MTNINAQHISQLRVTERSYSINANSCSKALWKNFNIPAKDSEANPIHRITRTKLDGFGFFNKSCGYYKKRSKYE